MNFCINCGTKLEEGVSDCPNCGFQIKQSGGHDREVFVNAYDDEVFVGQYDEDDTASVDNDDDDAAEYDVVTEYEEDDTPFAVEYDGDEDVSEEDLEASARLAVSFFDEDEDEAEDEEALPGFNKVKGALHSAAGKLAAGAQDMLETAGASVREHDAAVEKARKKKHRQTVKNTIPQNDESTRYMSSKEMWSWLKQNAKRQLFYTEEVSEITEEEFMDMVSDKLEENGVPAIIEMKRIQWDRSSVNRSNYYVKPITNVVNPLSCLLQFNHVGKYTFVEEKTFITPPDLPKVEEKMSVDPNAANLAIIMVVFGILLALVGVFLLAESPLLGLAMLAGGVYLTYRGAKKSSEFNEVAAHNKRCEQQAAAWIAAWKNWENSIFVHSFQEDVNGQLSRINDAVFECIKQVCSELFDEKPSIDKEESTNMNELEEQIARRKEEYR